MARLHLVEDSDEEGGYEAPSNLDEVSRDYMPLVRHVVNRVASGSSKTSILEYEDLISYGVQGLIEAFYAYDSSRGTKFSTFAMPRIRGSILDALRAAHPLTRSLQKVASTVERTTYELTMQLGRAPTRQEIAGRMGMTEFEFQQASRMTNVKTVSLENLVALSDTGGIDKFIHLADDDLGTRPDSLVEQFVTNQQLIEAVAELPERERMVITLYYLKSQSLRSIAKLLEVSESRVSQLRHRAVQRLRDLLAEDLPEAA